MTLQASGQITLNDVYSEAVNYGGFSGLRSLRDLSRWHGWNDPPQSLWDEPHALSEFYGLEALSDDDYVIFNVEVLNSTGLVINMTNWNMFSNFGFLHGPDGRYGKYVPSSQIPVGIYQDYGEHRLNLYDTVGGSSGFFVYSVPEHSNYDINFLWQNKTVGSGGEPNFYIGDHPGTKTFVAQNTWTSWPSDELLIMGSSAGTADGEPTRVEADILIEYN